MSQKGNRLQTPNVKSQVSECSPPHWKHSTATLKWQCVGQKDLDRELYAREESKEESGAIFLGNEWRKNLKLKGKC